MAVTDGRAVESWARRPIVLQGRAWVSAGTRQAARVSAAQLAAGLLAAGPTLLAIFMLLGRPPLSWPTLAGLRLFVPGTAALALLWEGEARLVAWRWRWDLAAARWWVLAGYAPLGLSWGLNGLLYLPAVHHWFVYVPSVKPAMAAAVLAPAAAVKLLLVAGALREPLRAWAWRWRHVLAALAYASAALLAKPSLWQIDLPGWFVPAAREVLSGHLLRIYQLRADVMGTPAPLEHGPLTPLFYAPFVALAEAAGKSDFLRVGAVFPLAGVLLVDALLAYQVTRALHDLAPQLSERYQFGLYVLILFSPLLWFSSVWLVHLESLQALLAVVALRLLWRGRAGWAGAALGTAMLLKHDAALVAAPLAIVLALAGRRREALALALVAGTLVAAGLLPFAIAAPADFAYNFFGYDAIKPIYGLTIWKASYDSGLEPLIMRWDSLVIGLLVIASAAALGVAWRASRRGQWPALEEGREPRLAGNRPLLLLCWKAVVLGQLTWLGLATWQYPHYFVTGFVTLLVWETAGVAERAAPAADGPPAWQIDNGMLAGLARRAAPAADGEAGWPLLSLLFLFVPYNLQAHFPSNVGKAGGPFVIARAAAQLAFLYGGFVAVWLRTTPAQGAASDERSIDTGRRRELATVEVDNRSFLAAQRHR